ncbi:helix-turn-helix domain-containing protein [Arthrobacter sp. ISL-69]|uniref:helix-turn-helix domain-containing protein n=1 Tax=Arthrobacter sp. ISL-69 TaxID=2819113 RepID=UPI001BE8EC64|nr:helix-turn-helix domain-containing protein [Arthrobacter sp. ISL-69]MBT2538685.1 helix-turn-helix domain-containing protein [Arthrobacter sp. ISL-69]
MTAYRPPRFSGLGAHVSGVSAWVLMAVLERGRAVDSIQSLPAEPRAEVLATLDTLKAAAIHWSDQTKAEGFPARAKPQKDAQATETATDGRKTPAQAAQLLGCSERRVRQLLAAGRLNGQMVAGRWLVDPASVEDYLLARDVA